MTCHRFGLGGLTPRPSVDSSESWPRQVATDQSADWSAHPKRVDALVPAMVREIRSAPLRYGLALGSFGLILLVIHGLPRVLVVDDEPDTLEIVSLVLSQHGASVHTTASASAAFEVFHELKPSVLVSDLGMPGEDGFELISKVRALPPEQRGDVPAVALTAYVREEDRQRALAAGYELHVKKPVDPNTLARAVAQVGKRKS